MKSFIGPNNLPYDDGKRVFYVNAEIDDRSSVADLIPRIILVENCFLVIWRGLYFYPL